MIINMIYVVEKKIEEQFFLQILKKLIPCIISVNHNLIKIWCKTFIDILKLLIL